MYTYTVNQWMLFFFIYCFLGWVFESTYVSICERRLVNRGFMRGPFLPLYGSGAILMLFVSIPVQEHIALMFLAGSLAATALEYVTGVCMEALFKVRYWDYSHKRFQYKGYICLSSSLAWGGLTVLLVKVIHKPVERAVESLHEGAAGVLVHVLTVAVAADFALSFQAALDLRDVLVRMSAMKEELEGIQQKAEQLLAGAQEDIRRQVEERLAQQRQLLDSQREAGRQRRQELEHRLDAILAGLGAHREQLGQPHPELDELRLRLRANRDRRRDLGEQLGSHVRAMLKSSPTASSREFRDALGELKERLEERRKQGK